MNSIPQLPTPISQLPDLYEAWPCDPGPRSYEPPPFPIRLGERLRFAEAIFYYSRRASDGTFLFEAENGAPPLLRSSWRILAEFNVGIIVRLDRGVRAHPSRAQEAAVNGLVPCDEIKRAITSKEDATAIILNRLREEQNRRVSAGLCALPIAGPRDKGERSPPTDNPKNLDEFIAKIWAELGLPLEKRPHWKTISEKRRETAHLETVSALHVIDGRKIAHQPLRIKEVKHDVIMEVLETQFATRKFETISGTRRDVNNQLHKMEFKKVGRTAIENRLKRLPGVELCAAKDGKKKSSQKYRVTGKLHLPTEPGTYVEFDWHSFDLQTKWPRAYECLSGLAGIPIPRVWLAAGIDVATWGLYGYGWSVGSVSRGDVMRAFAHMVRSKPSYAHLGVKGAWLPRGLMKILAFDHGNANLASDVVRAVTNLSVEIAVDEMGNPPKRPHIERFFGKVEQMFISKLDGALGRNTTVRPDTVSPVNELVAVDELDSRFIKFIVDGHAIHTPSTRWLSPNSAWLQYEKSHPGWAPDTARSEADLDRELRISVRRRARTEGVRVKHIFYNDDSIKKIRSDAHAHSKGDPEVEIRIHPDNVSDAIVHDPHRSTGGWKPAECCYRGYAPGISMSLHNIVLNAAKIAKKAEEEVNEPLLNETLAVIKRRVREKAMKRGASKRAVGGAARIAQLRGPGGATPMHGAPPHARPDKAPSGPSPHRSEGGAIDFDEAFDPAEARALLLKERPVSFTNRHKSVESDGASEQTAAQVETLPTNIEDDNDDAY